jgi:tRNA-Thr(GGU) m(6)t(6)A37 methyltransferase TsaA
LYVHQVSIIIKKDNGGTTMNQSSDTITLRPVGVVHNTINKPFLVAGDEGITMRGEFNATRTHIRESKDEISEIVINEDFVGILDGIDEYSHVIVLYWAHEVPEQSRSLTKVHPMGRKENPLVGIYATCSPARPNPVLMTVVRLCTRRGNVLEVTGLDAVNGSPVIDIKPYVPNHFPRDEVRIPEWMHRIHEEFGDRNR